MTHFDRTWTTQPEAAALVAGCATGAGGGAAAA